jgi:geranylgeranyl pyrophosphate synthase
LPVLYALDQDGDFAKRWNAGPINPEEVPGLSNQLEIEGARDYTTQKAHELTEQALQALEDAQPRGEAAEALRELANWLLGRQS